MPTRANSDINFERASYLNTLARFEDNLKQTAQLLKSFQENLKVDVDRIIDSVLNDGAERLDYADFETYSLTVHCKRLTLDNIHEHLAVNLTLACLECAKALKEFQTMPVNVPAVFERFYQATRFHTAVLSELTSKMESGSVRTKMAYESVDLLETNLAMQKVEILSKNASKAAKKKHTNDHDGKQNVKNQIYQEWLEYQADKKLYCSKTDFAEKVGEKFPLPDGEWIAKETIYNKWMPVWNKEYQKNKAQLEKQRSETEEVSRLVDQYKATYGDESEP